MVTCFEFICLPNPITNCWQQIVASLQIDSAAIEFIEHAEILLHRIFYLVSLERIFGLKFGKSKI